MSRRWRGPHVRRGRFLYVPPAQQTAQAPPWAPAFVEGQRPRALWLRRGRLFPTPPPPAAPVVPAAVPGFIRRVTVRLVQAGAGTTSTRHGSPRWRQSGRPPRAAAHSPPSGATTPGHPRQQHPPRHRRCRRCRARACGPCSRAGASSSGPRLRQQHPPPRSGHPVRSLGAVCVPQADVAASFCLCHRPARPLAAAPQPVRPHPAGVPPPRPVHLDTPARICAHTTAPAARIPVRTSPTPPARATQRLLHPHTRPHRSGTVRAGAVQAAGTPHDPSTPRRVRQDRARWRSADRTRMGARVAVAAGNPRGGGTTRPDSHPRPSSRHRRRRGPCRSSSRAGGACCPSAAGRSPPPHRPGTRPGGRPPRCSTPPACTPDGIPKTAPPGGRPTSSAPTGPPRTGPDGGSHSSPEPAGAPTTEQEGGEPGAANRPLLPRIRSGRSPSNRPRPALQPDQRRGGVRVHDRQRPPKHLVSRRMGRHLTNLRQPRLPGAESSSAPEAADPP
jgi:hypothetical protein